MTGRCPEFGSLNVDLHASPILIYSCKSFSITSPFVQVKKSCPSPFQHSKHSSLSTQHRVLTDKIYKIVRLQNTEIYGI